MTEWVWHTTSPDGAEALAAYIKEVEQQVQDTHCRWACGDNLRFPSPLDLAERALATEAWEESQPSHMVVTVLLVRRYHRFLDQRKAGGE